MRFNDCYVFWLNWSHLLTAVCCIGVTYRRQRVEQIDVAVTLAVLFAVPIPVNSLGVLIADTLARLSQRDQLKAAYMNAMQIMRVAQTGLTDYTHSKYSQQCFYSACNARIASAVLATAIPSVCLSVRLSVCLSHAGIVSKRRHVARCSFHRWIGKCV